MLDAIFKALGAALGTRLPDHQRRRELTWRRTSFAPRQRPAPFQGAPYSQAIVAGDFVFVSGQLGAASRATRDSRAATIEEQTEQVFTNLGAILEAAGTGLDRLVKTTVFLADLGRLRTA